ncbi:MAG: hypothetical protein P8I03_02755 [Thalassotalea sp.]|nr:hypothetical protein [Thalassotalea sp.]
MMNALKEKLEATTNNGEVRDIMCNFFCCNTPKLINGKDVIDYTILNDRVEIDSNVRYEMFTVDDVANAVIVDEWTLQVPNPRRLNNQIVTLTF